MTPLDIPVPVRWTDLDLYGHVNNAAMLRLLEEARIHAFWPVPEGQEQFGAEPAPIPLPVDADGSAIQTFVASNRIEYLRPLDYRRDGIIVRLWISRLGGASLHIDYHVLTRDDLTAPYASARSVLVLVDQSGTPSRITEDMRKGLTPYLGEPLTFRD